MTAPALPAGVDVAAPAPAELADVVDVVLAPAALDFVAALHRRFDPERRALLDARAERQRRFDAGERPDFRAETAAVRAGG